MNYIRPFPNFITHNTVMTPKKILQIKAYPLNYRIKVNSLNIKPHQSCNQCHALLCKKFNRLNTWMDSKGNAKILQIVNHKSYTFSWTIFFLYLKATNMQSWKLSNTPSGQKKSTQRESISSVMVACSRVD